MNSAYETPEFELVKMKDDVFTIADSGDTSDNTDIVV